MDQAERLLIVILARRDAMFWPHRLLKNDAACAVRERRQEYVSGAYGISLKASGSFRWKSAERERNYIIENGWARGVYSGGQTTSLILTPAGEARARAMVGDRLSTIATAKPLIERLERLKTSPDGMDYFGEAWTSESELFEIPCYGSSEDWDHKTETILPALIAGLVTSNWSSAGHVWYSLKHGYEIPEIVESEGKSDPDWDDLYITTANSEWQSIDGWKPKRSCDVWIPLPVSFARGTKPTWGAQRVTRPFY